MTLAEDATTAGLGFETVNSAINRVLFDGRFRLAPVYLDIEGDAEEEIAALLNVAAADCGSVIAQAAASSLKWNLSDPFIWHQKRLEAWDADGRREPPPFTGLLAALSLAAERMRADDVYSAQNYYERLFEVLDVTQEGRKQSLRQHAKSALPFWLKLNLWLQEQDFEYGRPTAKRINDWKYASYALSQALVRHADRKRLHGLFAAFGFAAHEKLTEAEMTLYLHDWMAGSGPSPWLKRIWAARDLRPRVAAAACAELESWEGVSADAGGAAARRRLSWAASLEIFPQRRLRMFLSAAASAEEGAAALRLPPGAAPAAAAAFERCAGAVWLTPAAGGDVAVIEPVGDIALSPLMLASFELKSDDGALGFHRAARSIIPLVKLDTGALYREASRISYLRPHLVLCHEKWTERVSQLLTQNARRGFKAWLPGSLPGLPDGWALFSGVEMLRASSSNAGDLQALIPLAEGVSVEMTGGLRLSQGLWHAGAPPEITATAASGPFKLELTAADGAVKAVSETNNASCRLTLQPDGWDADDLTLTAWHAGKDRSGTSLSFRSAAYPRRIAEPLSARAYALSTGDAAGFQSAGAAADHPVAGLQVQGLALHGVCAAPEASDSAAAAPAAVLDQAAGAADELPPGFEAGYHLHKAEGLTETCVLRGFHHWECQDFNAGDDPQDEMWMVCKTCEYRVLTRNRGKAKPVRPGLRARPAAAIQAKPPGMAPRVDAPPSANLVFDALCYLGGGSWRRLQDLTGTEGRPPLAAQRMSAALTALGHIDVSWDTRMRTPLSWVVPPPALSFTPSGQAVLAGFRNTPLLAALEEQLARAGGTLTALEQEDAPDAFIWTGLTPAAAREALTGLQDAHGRPVSVTEGFTAASAAHAPRVSTLAAAMAVIRLDAPKGLQRFDPGQGVWRNIQAIGAEGAYRGDFAGRRYIYAGADGAQREGSYSLVKLLAAKAAGLRLHGYDAASQTFEAVLGCEPPGLFQRALTASSGRMRERAGARLLYRGVEAADAAAILQKLYS